MLRLIAPVWKCPDFLPEMSTVQYPRNQDTDLLQLCKVRDIAGDIYNNVTELDIPEDLIKHDKDEE